MEEASFERLFSTARTQTINYHYVLSNELQENESLDFEFRQEYPGTVQRFN